MVLTEPRAIQKIHCNGQRPKQAYLHSGATSITVPTGKPIAMIWTGLRALYVIASFYLLQGDRQNRPHVTSSTTY